MRVLESEELELKGVIVVRHVRVLGGRKVHEEEALIYPQKVQSAVAG